MTKTKEKFTKNKVEDKIFDNITYLRSFGWDSEFPENSLKYEGTTRLAKAYEVALDVRKFEIELYWKRSTNFWLLITGISTALGLLAASTSPANNVPGLLTNSSKEVACLILSLAATMLCAAWFLANKASKFWQHSWERQVDILEQELVGPLYKTVISDLGNFNNKSHFSVSEINKHSSAYLCLIYLFISIYFLGIFDFLNPSIKTEFSLSKAMVVIFNSCYLIYFRRSVRMKTNEQKNNLDLHVEAVVRSVNLKELHSSVDGEKTLTPKEKVKKTQWLDLVYKYFKNCRAGT